MSETQQTRSFSGAMGISPYTARLIAFLRTKARGDTVTDEELTQACGRPCGRGGAGRSNLRTAIHRVLVEDGIDWQRVRGAQCIQAFQSSETAGTVHQHRDRIRREARRGMKRVATVKLEELDQSAKTTFLATAAQIGALYQFGRTDATKTLAARKVTESPDMTRMLEAFVKRE